MAEMNFKMFIDLTLSKKPLDKKRILAPVALLPPGQEGQAPPSPPCSGTPVYRCQAFENYEKLQSLATVLSE